MFKYYAMLRNLETDESVTIGEYSRKVLDRSIRGCLRQKNWDGEKCQITVYGEDMETGRIVYDV